MKKFFIKKGQRERSSQWLCQTRNAIALLGLVALLVLPLSVNAQNASDEVTISGVVSDDMGSLPGVTVQVKGTSVGTITNLDGEYTLSLSQETTILQFSFIGMTTQEVVIAGQTKIDVVMSADAQLMDELVVTALGIKREKKAIGYAVQEVGSDDLNKTGDGNVMNALSGKVAGVQISEGSNGAGGSSRIEIRGVSSLTGDDEPLWVVDGVPFDNGGGNDANIYGGTSSAGGAFDINPEDIESISILKGPNAAALYGERGGNGVIVVTTKKGKAGVSTISYTGNVTVSDVAYLLDYQDRFGQGSGSEYVKNATGSWGEEMKGQMVETFTGETVAYSPQENLIQDFTRTGVSQKHNLSFAGGSEAGSYRASIGKDIVNGIYEGNKVDKMTFDLRADYNIKPWLNIDTKVSYFETEGNQRPELGTYSYMSAFNTIPRSISTDYLSPGYNIVGGEHVETLYTTVNAANRNPYFLQEQWISKDNKNRTFGYAAANLTLMEGLTARLKYSIDTYRLGVVNGYQYADNINDQRPNYTSKEKFFKEQNYEFLISYNKEINKDWTTSVSFGGNTMNSYSESLATESGKLASEDGFFLNNGTEKKASESFSEYEIRSLYGFGQIAYRNMLFLDVTGRNDWSSTLTAADANYDNSYFYPSVSLSALLSEMVDLPSQISFAKIRGSYAVLSKSAEAYATSQSYTVESWNYGLLKSEVPGTLVVKDLKPETSSSWEVGADLRFFENRIGLDVTYYNESTKNQILAVDLDQSTGYDKRLINAGLIENKGLEIMLSTVPVRTDDFTLGINFNFATNNSVLKELADGVPEYRFDDFNGGIELMGLPGEALGQIRGRTYKRDANGNKIVGDDGTYAYLEQQILGDVQADFTGSIGLSADYKGLFITALLSMQQGGEIVSITEQSATAAGTAARTDYMNRIDLFADGVHEDGSTNNELITAQEYWGSVAGIDEEFVYDASYMKLKELAIGYNLPKELLQRVGKNPVKTARISAVGRNLFYLYKHTPGTTPDAGAYNSSFFAKAIDFAPVPNTRTYGVTLNLTF